MSEILFRATPSPDGDRLGGLLKRVREAKPGERNDVLNWAAHLVATSDDLPDKQAAGEALLAAAMEAGLDQREAVRTIQSAYSARDVHVGDYDVAPHEPDPDASEWPSVWRAHHPRLHPIAPNQKYPTVAWQFTWGTEAERRVWRPQPGDRYGMAVPPGTVILDIDDLLLFAQVGHDAPVSPARQQTPSGGWHFGYRLHPDRAIPGQQVNKTALGYDTRIGGKGQIVVYDEAMLSDPAQWPLAPDWLQPAPDLGIVNIRDYLADVPLTPFWLIDNFAFLHGVSMLSGPPKSGKSTLTADALRCRETGEDFIGNQSRIGPTLLVTEEGGVPVRFKYGELSELAIFDQQAAGGETFRDTLTRIGDWADQQSEPALVVIDTLAAWGAVENENDAAEMTRVVNDVKALAMAKNVGILLIHHSRKGGGERGEAIRGSGAVLAVMDHVMEITPVRDESNQRRIHVMSRVLPEDTGWLVDFDSTERRYTVITKQAEEQMTQAAIEADVARIPATGPGMLRRNMPLDLQKRLNHLVNIGRVRAAQGRSKTNLYWGIPPAGPDPYPDDDDEE